MSATEHRRFFAITQEPAASILWNGERYYPEAELIALREANRKLHRRAQVAEGVIQSGFDYLDGWITVLSTSRRETAKMERWMLGWHLRNARKRLERNRNRMLAALKVEEPKG